MQDFSQIIDNILARKVAFLVTFFLIFTLSYAILYALDFYPETTKSEAKEVTSSTTANVVTTKVITKPEIQKVISIGTSSLPIKLVIPSLEKTITVLNPASRSVTALDNALLSGVVRHPDSASLVDEGTILIMGHSSYLPTVHNYNFQAFNGIQNLKWGDSISLFSSDTEYVYRVEKVYKAKASLLTVPVNGTGHTLTLATCNSFGSKDDRFIVEATLIKTNLIK